MRSYDAVEALLEGVLERLTLLREDRTIRVFSIEIFGDGERVRNPYWRTAARVDYSREGIVWLGWVIGFCSIGSASELDECALNVRK